jgi:hypothetical protein
MKPTRRTVLRLLSLASAYLPASVLLAAPMGRLDTNTSVKALGPFLDTLMPPDNLSPGATALGVDHAITARFPRNQRLEQLVGLGCAWLEQEARKAGGKDFASISPVQRDAIVSAAEASPPRSMARVFFDTLLGLTWLHYYTRAESWAGLGYTGPPQPVGFPGHDKPLNEIIG